MNYKTLALSLYIIGNWKQEEGKTKRERSERSFFRKTRKKKSTEKIPRDVCDQPYSAKLVNKGYGTLTHFFSLSL